ncbi:Beta-1,2-xylosyltransferase 1 [Vanrija pseudolonga]|uniref:Beta-1,2-xylosyltransferase 1 n=1 Tax=Vanrija pseudolonga TaxID=143232 RepID=A0AAF1BPS4_9TREE|nr:Beta-1,2-xylosyltransferase 1 [Vanrija pseudolonga]
MLRSSTLVVGPRLGSSTTQEPKHRNGADRPLTGQRLSRVEEASSDDDDAYEKERRHRRHVVVGWLHNPAIRKRLIVVCVSVVAVYVFIMVASSMLPSELVEGGADTASAVNMKGGSHLKVPPVKEHRAGGGGATNAAAAAKKKERERAAGQVSFAGSDHKVQNGRLLVNPNSKKHPINQLISTAQSAWDAKVAKQSKTLKQAVAEYKRRHHRQPPAGFDKWWAYVVDNNVQMPDEYDQIERDMRPFYALQSKDLRERIDMHSNDKDTYTIKVTNGKITTTAQYKDEAIHHARLKSQLDLIKDVAQWIPDMKAIYTVHDTPMSLINWDHRVEIADRLEEDEYLDTAVNVEGDSVGWAAACPPSSQLRKKGEKYAGPNWDVDAKSFIVSHYADMDVCNHPELVALTGILAGKKPLSTNLLPIFAISKTRLHSDILGVPPERYNGHVELVPWEKKTNSHLLWRGANTGMHYGATLPWRDTQRVRLLGMSAEKTGTLDVIAPPSGMKSKTVGDAVKRMAKGPANERYFDMGFVGKAIQCEVEDGTCAEIDRNYPFKKRVTPIEADSYKYIVDIDGNAWSARFQRLVASGSLIFKATIMPEWWTDRIQPWVHYVPVKADFTDLYDSLAYFSGDLEGNGAEDELAKKIALAGRDWSLTHFRMEDMTAYVFRMYLEWARLQAPNRGSMNFVYDPSMERERK